MGLRKISKEDEAYSPPLSPDLEERLPALSKEAYPFFESLSLFFRRRRDQYHVFTSQSKKIQILISPSPEVHKAHHSGPCLH